MTKHETVEIKLTPCQRQQLRTALTIAFETKFSIDPGCSPGEWLGVMDAVFREETDTDGSGYAHDG
jgi:hypothetical protein